LRERLDGLNDGQQPHDLVARLTEEANEIEEGLKSGDYKRCNKCNRDLPIDMFQDSTTKSGYGRFCRECKPIATSTRKPRFRRYYPGW